MDQIRQYILGILACSVICGILNSFFPDKGAYGAIIRLLTGVFMTVTLISPLVKFELSELTAYLDGISVDANASVEQGREFANTSMKEIIKSETEAYILDKAASLKLNLIVEVTLSESDPPIPESVELKGSASPYAKKQLKEYIARELGIPEDQQEWT